MNRRTKHLWKTWNDAWLGTDPAHEEPTELPRDALDLAALALFLDGTIDALDLRRARWLAPQPGSRLVFLLLTARWRQGRTSVLETNLLEDLRDLGTFDPDSALLGTVLEGVREAVRGVIPELSTILDTGLSGLDDAPTSLIRRSSTPRGGVIAFARFRDSEPDLSRRLRVRLEEPAETRYSIDTDPEILLDRTPALHEQQKDAVRRALLHRTLIVAGGPGTGKTTVVARILEALASRQGHWSSDRVALCAPTGRAKARLQESIASQSESATTYSAWTLHSLLGPRPNGTFRHDQANPLPWDVVVLDEASMVDQSLFAGLLASLHPRTRLIILGDPDQLPSVEAGGTFGDLVAHLESLPSLSRPFVRLTHTWRNTGAVRELAAEVNSGSTELVDRLESASPEPSRTSEQKSSVRWLHGPLEEVVRSWWSEQAATQGPGVSLAESVRSSRILCATHGGQGGRERINVLGEEWLRTLAPRSTGTHRLERPLLLTRNIPSSDLWNGDLGEGGMVDGIPVVRFPGQDRDRVFPMARLDGLEAAWAITIHKSQGSEFDHVLLILPEDDSPLLTRQILYTGLTRARRTLSIWGRKDLWNKAVARRDDRSSPLFDLS